MSALCISKGVKPPTEALPQGLDVRQQVTALYQTHSLGLVKLAVLMVGDQTTAAPTKTTFSAPCAASVTARDGTVVCGTSSFSDVSFKEVCSTVPPSFVTYSGTTGKRLKVLYQYHGQCLEAQAMPVWTDATGSHVIAFLLLSEKGVKTSLTDKFGLVADGHFTSLPKLVTGITGADLDLGGLAF